MAEVILMPRLSDTMTEGVISAWIKKVGDVVKSGDIMAEIETDKATMELESYKDGTLLYIGAEKGGKVQVNDLLYIIGEKGEDISKLLSGQSQLPTSVGEKAPAVESPAETVQPAPASIPTIDVTHLEEVVLMPRLSDTMTEGVIAGWNKKVGDTVKKGDVLADIETDKATMELESYKDGILLYQGAKAGEKILVNDLLCIIGKADFDIAPVLAALKGGAVLPTESNKAAQAPTAAPTEEKKSTPAQGPLVVNEGRIFASPLAKKIASEKGIDLRYVKGTGDNGRIIKNDLETALPVSIIAASAQVAPSPLPAIAATEPKASVPAPTVPKTTTATSDLFEDVPISQMRKVIAKRLSESLFTAPHFFLTMSIDMDAAIAARVKLNENGKVKISFNDLVLKATAVSLKQHPKLNSSWLGDKIRYNHQINIGVAVAVEEGLLVPVVRNADTLGLSQIAAKVKDFAQKAKDKKLQPSDWEGSTFTISNLGMFGIDEFTAIINPPDSCILAIGGISAVPVVKNGQVVPGNVMKVTLSCDHRVVDGATGAAFLQTLKSLLEDPLKMLL